MRYRHRILVLLLLIAAPLAAQNKSFMTYYQMNNFQQASPGAFKFGLYGFDNPALLGYLNNPVDLQLSFGSTNNFQSLDNWGIFYGTPMNGFGAIHHKVDSVYVTDYRYSLSFGDRTFGLGLSYGFSGENKGRLGRSNSITIGGLLRPFRELSLEAMYTKPFETSESETVVGLAVRPIGTYPLAVFADMGIFNNQSLKDANWSAGLSWEVVNGLRLNGRYFKDKSINLGFDFSFGNSGISTVSQMNDKQQFNSNTLSLRFGAPDRTILPALKTGDNYVKLNLNGSIGYQKFMFFDKSQTLSSILEFIDDASRDNSIKGIVINATKLEANQEILWEIREKLRDFKEHGKKVIMFVERIGMSGYHFASIADKIVLDPLGGISLEGYLLQRSFYKNMLDKIGIGFEELRFFKYKSAAEGYSREKMSEADKEQRQRLVDEWYDITRNEVCASRNIKQADFDSLVFGELEYMPKLAIEKKLVDTLGRWNDADKILTALDKKAKIINPMMVDNSTKPIDDRWGETSKKIAIVYAIGACDMESGIAARSLVNDVQKVMKDSSIKAVVIRVDSPGGDAMASDYIAEVIRQSKGSKPIIVSQGFVAASGGYWLSMDADQIVASPLTITGSIGVISSYMYDKGISKDLGITTDYVKAGKYSELGHAVIFPIIPIGIPARNLNSDERGQFERTIKTMYADFVEKVATGRKKKKEDIEEVAQGRVWSGKDGLKHGLVDELGGLWKAMEIASAKAGINMSKDDVDIVEYPVKKAFDLTSLFSMLTGVDMKAMQTKYGDLKFRMDNLRHPMAVMPLDFYDLIPIY